MAGTRSTTGDGAYPARDDETRPDVGPDVLLDVPALNAEQVDLQAEQVRVRVSFGAELGNMVKINVGLEAEVDNFELQVKGLQAQAQLKARLDNVREIFSEVLTTLENNPSMAQDLMGDMGHVTDEPEEPDEPPSVTLESEEPATNGNTDDSREIPATDAAREKARQLEMDLGGVEGTGAGGRILLRDVVAANGN